MKRFLLWMIKFMIGVSLISLLVLILPRLITGLFAQSRIFSLQSVEKQPVAIVFGAGIRRDGTPTLVLRDRIATAAALYQQGKVQKILMSGDNSTIYYDEPSAMRSYAIQLGVPEADIVLDYAGLRTYDTCYRAKAIFGITDAILVTQAFHLPRALYTCNQLGVQASGVPAEQYAYRRSLRAYWNIRETAATLVALIEVNITRPTPILGQPEPIFKPEV